MITTEDIIRTAVHKMRAPRGERFVFVQGRGMTTHTAGERVLHLPNGVAVKVTTSDCDHTTQVEEDDALHAVVRPSPLVYKTRRMS